MRQITSRAAARKTAYNPDFLETDARLDEDAPITQQQMFPRAMAAANRQILSQVEALLGCGPLPLTELLLETAQRAGGAGWLADRLRRYNTADIRHLRAPAGGRP